MTDFNDIAELLSIIPTNSAALITPLHEIAVANHCVYRIDTMDDGYRVNYSVRNYYIHVSGETVSFGGDYDLRAFMQLYKGTNDSAVKELLFHAAAPCEYCIDDKCTTFLMAEQRTIKLKDKSKKLCAPWRHHLHIEVTSANISAYWVIGTMMFEYTHGYMHIDLFKHNEVTYTLTEMKNFYIVGYKAVHNQFTVSDEEFVASLLAKDDNGKRKIDDVLEATSQTDTGQYIGATDNFTNGVLYDYIFGVMCDTKPESLPENLVCRKLRRGEWAVYNSTAGDYKSIWQHFTDHFYDAEHKGYDTARIPFEYYDKDGHLSDVHIPIDPDMGKDSAKTWVLVQTPNIKLAGFTNYIENDHPLHKDFPFDLTAKLKELFPYSDKIINTSIHSIFGKPMQIMNGVVIGDLTPVPDGLEIYELQGGYWHVEGRRHFNGGSCGWNFDSFYNSLLTRDTLAHPRSFDEYVYNARGGYTEIVAPVRVRGQRSCEVMELTPQRVIGKLEAPPLSVVTADEKRAFYTMDVNADKGSYMIGYTLTKVKNMVFYDKPLVKGVLTDDGVLPPDGYQAYQLEGGKFLKVTETMPLGEPGWEIEWVNSNDFEKETGHIPDLSRQIIIRQYGYGLSYEFFIPIR